MGKIIARLRTGRITKLLTESITEFNADKGVHLAASI